MLKWIIDRCEGRAPGLDTPIGAVPTRESLEFAGLDIQPSTIDELLAVDHDAWRREVAEIGKYLESYGNRLPGSLANELSKLNSRLD